MFRRTRIRLAAILAVAAFLLLSSLSGVDTAHAAPSSPFFSVSLARGPQDGYVVRDGGFTIHSHNGPFYELYGYVSNTLFVHSLRGFEGTIEMDVSNLPAGITVEQTFPSTIELERGDFLLFPLRITVDETVPLETQLSGITISGTSGGVTKTATVSALTVVDPLPCTQFWAPAHCYFPGGPPLGGG